ncbi:acyl-CoA dehydrogenase family protein [Rhodococcus aetherivorans]
MTVLTPLEESLDDYLGLHQSLDEPSIDAQLTERELEVRRRTREVVSREVAPRARSADENGGFVGEGVRALADAGLMGLVFPRELGGSGDSNVAYATAMEEISAACGSTSLVFMTQMHAAYPIMTFGSESLAKQWVPGLLDGSILGSLAITEPGAGSDVSGLRTRAVHDAATGGYRLSGSKTFITTGDRSGVIVCFATTDRAKGRDGIGAFVVDGSQAEVRRGTPFAKLGMRASSTAEVFFDNAFVPSDALLGGVGGGWRVVMQSVVKSRISAAAQGVGLARAAYARTLHALRCVSPGRLSDEHLFALATLRGRIAQGRLLLITVARHVDENPDVPTGLIGMMKQSCTDLGWDVAAECARILGPLGDLADVGVERCLRDAKVTQIYDGTNEVQRLLIGREINRTATARDRVSRAVTVKQEESA